MFKKLKWPPLGTLASTNRTQTQSGLVLSPPSPAPAELPEIRVQVEESSNFYNFVAPPPCVVCDPLTACAERAVPAEALFRSADNGCSICSLFRKVCMQAGNIDSFDYVSTWSGSRGGFGVYLIEKYVEDGKEVAGQTLAVMALASDGGNGPG
jgi:hypothetical protein